MSEKRYDPELGEYIYETNSGEDWVSFKSENGKQSTTTRYKWDKLPTEPENAINDEEWPYSQE